LRVETEEKGHYATFLTKNSFQGKSAFQQFENTKFFPSFPSLFFFLSLPFPFRDAVLPLRGNKSFLARVTS